MRNLSKASTVFTKGRSRVNIDTGHQGLAVLFCATSCARMDSLVRLWLQRHIMALDHPNLALETSRESSCPSFEIWEA